MNCLNCAAPMVLVRDRDYFRCEHCGSFHFPRENDEGIRPLRDDQFHVRDLLGDIRLVLHAHHSQAVLIPMLRVVGPGSLFHGLEEFVGQGLHHENDGRFLGIALHACFLATAASED